MLVRGVYVLAFLVRKKLHATAAGVLPVERSNFLATRPSICTCHPGHFICRLVITVFMSDKSSLGLLYAEAQTPDTRFNQV